jgi:hypothetical protein
MRQHLLLTIALAIGASLLSACDDPSRPMAPVSSNQLAAASEERLVTMMEACDPKTFEAAHVAQLSGNPVSTPECRNLSAGEFIAPGASASDEIEELGIEHYQCCIHPWMRLVVQVRP